MRAGDIFKHSDAREVLVKIFQEKKDQNPQFSLRAWAKKLGFNNPSYLSEVLRGTKSLRPKKALQIFRHLGLPEDERTYLEALVYLDNTNDPTERDFFQAIIKKFKPKEQERDFEEQLAFQTKSWIYWILDEMTLLKDFKEDPKYLASRLGPQITPQMVEMALKDMEEIGMIKRDKKKRLIRAALYHFPHLRSPEIKRHGYETYRKIIWEKMAESYFNQPENQTLYKTSPIPIRKKDVEKMREHLAQFRKDFRTKFEAPSLSADEVYILDVNLFQLTVDQPKSGRSGQ